MTVASRAASAVLSLHADTIREVLPNGLTLLIRRDTSAPVVAIVTHVKAGYFDESDDIVGIAHVLEHMYFKGTPSHAVGEIARATKAAGGYLNAHTIYDHTSYFTVLPSESFVRGLDIQFDAFANSVIDEDELARELEVIIQEEKRKRDTPSSLAIESLYALLHDHHRIRRWRIGEEHMLRSFTRNQVDDFYRYWYQPGNTILSIVGDVDPDLVRREVMSRYGALPAGTPARATGPREVNAPGFRVRDWEGDIAQQQIAFGWRAPSQEHVDSAALDLAAIALGSGRASRLYRAVRERELASSVSAWDYTAGDVGVFVCHAESPPQHGREATLQLWRETMAAREQGLRPSELNRAQRIIEARWLRRIETMDGQATYLSTWEAEGGLDFGLQYYDRLLSLGGDEVHGALQRHLDPRQASIVSYRPTGSEALAESNEQLAAMLRTVEGSGSSVLPPPDVVTPPSTPVIEAPSIATGVNRVSIDYGVHQFRTPGDVPVLVLRRPGAPLVNIGIFQRGGAMAEPAQRDGLARLVTQSSLKGTQRRSGTRIAETAEAMGSSIGVSTSLENIGWTMSVPLRHFDAASELLADVTQRALFPDVAVEVERKLAIAELARLRDDMYRWPMRLATSTAYGNHPYSRSVLGTDETLPMLDAESARAFHDREILNGSTVIGIVGDIDEEAAEVISREFSLFQWREDAAPPPVEWPSQSRFAEDTRDKKQTALAMLFEGPGRHDASRYAARVLSSVASGLGGRFFEQLRDKQSLAYTVTAFPVERRAGGMFGAYIATSPLREDEAREGLLNEFRRFTEAPPSDEEMERARRYLVGTHAISMQSGSTVLGEMVDAWMFGEGLHELHDFASQVQQVTPDLVLEMARRFFNPDRRVEGVVRGTGA